MQSVKFVITTLNEWLSPANHALRTAIFKTVEENLFSFEDIHFQLEVLRNNVEQGEVQKWIEKVGLSEENNAKGKKVLCLHAGNLPLVGFQTALAVIVSGADYYGKLSRKDPYLLASFLKVLQEADTGQEIHFSTDLPEFESLHSDAVVFAGSEESVPTVKKEITSIKAAKPEADYIIRTAKFSIAYLHEWNDQVKDDLTEAMLRYGGKGCRSVAMIVSDFGIDEVKEELQTSIQKFWEENPPYQNPAPDLNYQHAYNKGVERKELWMKNFLIQETEEMPETDFTVNWVRGDVEKVRELGMQFGELVQSVYTTGIRIDGLETEPLASAQKPPLWWKPDGVDVVGELIT